MNTYTLSLNDDELNLLKQFVNSDTPILARGARVIVALADKLESAVPDVPTPNKPDTGS